MFRPRLVHHMCITYNPVHLNYFRDSGVLNALIHMGICMTNCQVFGILETIHWCYNLIYFNNLSRTLFCNVIVCLWKFRPALKFCEESQRMFCAQRRVQCSFSKQESVANNSSPLSLFHLATTLVPTCTKTPGGGDLPFTGTFFSELRVCKRLGEAKEAFKIHYRAHEHRWGFYLV